MRLTHSDSLGRFHRKIIKSFYEPLDLQRSMTLVSIQIANKMTISRHHRQTLFAVNDVTISAHTTNFIRCFDSIPIRFGKIRKDFGRAPITFLMELTEN
jgi:hypothetical protein